MVAPHCRGHISNDRRVGYGGFLNARGYSWTVTGGFASSVDCGDLNSPLTGIVAERRVRND